MCSPRIEYQWCVVQDPHKVGEEIGSYYCHRLGLVEKASNVATVGKESVSETAAAGSGQLARVLQEVAPKKPVDGWAEPGVNRVGIAAADKALAMVREKAQKEKEVTQLSGLAIYKGVTNDSYEVYYSFKAFRGD